MAAVGAEKRQRHYKLRQNEPRRQQRQRSLGKDGCRDGFVGHGAGRVEHRCKTTHIGRRAAGGKYMTSH